MVLEIFIDNTRFYACEACGLVYTDLTIASACEEWCTTHRSCNRELSRNALGYVRKYRKGKLRLL